MNVKEIVESIKSKRIRAKEVVEECFSRIKEKEKEINAFITLFEEEAISWAEEIDKNFEKLKDKKKQ